MTFILGGARSGKSAYAERLVTAHRVALGLYRDGGGLDDEMRARIDAHRARRGVGWRTIEAPQDSCPPPFTRRRATAPLLIDCLAIWLSNRMFAQADLAADRAGLIAALSARAAPTVVVSPEVGLSIVPENALARAFRDAAGVLHQEIAAISAQVALVVAGYPVKVK